MQLVLHYSFLTKKLGLPNIAHPPHYKKDITRKWQMVYIRVDLYYCTLYSTYGSRCL